MKPFLNEDFLLTTATARTLYHDVAVKQPIIDYHCHIDPREIYEDRRFVDLSQLWLGATIINGGSRTEKKFISSPTSPWACGSIMRNFATV